MARGFSQLPPLDCARVRRSSWREHIVNKSAGSRPSAVKCTLSCSAWPAVQRPAQPDVGSAPLRGLDAVMAAYRLQAVRPAEIRALFLAKNVEAQPRTATARPLARRSCRVSPTAHAAGDEPSQLSSQARANVRIRRRDGPLDRLLHHAVVIQIEGSSYRLSRARRSSARKRPLQAECRHQSHSTDPEASWPAAKEWRRGSRTRLIANPPDWGIFRCPF